MKTAQVCFFLSLVFIVSASKAQNYDQLRTLFALGKWQEVLELAPEGGARDIQVMRLESLLQLGELGRAQEVARRVMPQLDPNQRKIVLRHLMRSAEQHDDVDSFFLYDKLYSELNREHSEEVSYWRGRMHFLARRFDLALSELSRVPLYSAYGIRSQYLMGAAELMAGERQFALNRFAKLKSVQAVDPLDAKIIGLATLSYAKLLYQMARYGEALRAFGENALDASSQLELAWTAMKFGDELLGKEPALAAAQYDSAFRVAGQIPADAFVQSEEDIRKRLLDAELKLRRGNSQASVSAFEEVMKDADRLAKGPPRESWLMIQPEMRMLENEIAEADRAGAELRALLARAEELNLSGESKELRLIWAKFESVMALLMDAKQDLVSSLRPRWEAYVARFSDSARVGLFSNRFRANARIERQIETLQQAKATALNHIDVDFESKEVGAPK